MKVEENYRELIIRFLAGDISEGDMEVLKVWLEADPSNRRIFDKENELWQESAIKTNPGDFKTDKAWTDLSARLGIGENKVKKVVILRTNNFRILIAAASIACLIGIGRINTLAV